MSILLLTLGSLALVAQVDGLRQGESARSIDAFEPGDPRAVVFGRVLDAATSAPLAGVAVEAWTEDWIEPAARLDDAVSARDGTFVVRLATDGLRS